jgi:hypothetical protein
MAEWQMHDGGRSLVEVLVGGFIAVDEGYWQREEIPWGGEGSSFSIKGR